MIHNTKETEGMVSVIFYPVGPVWSDVGNVIHFQIKGPVPYNKRTQTPDSYNYMFMSMGFITGITFRLNFKVTDIKGRFLTKPACQLYALDIMETVSIGILIIPGISSLPGEVGRKF